MSFWTNLGGMKQVARNQQLHEKLMLVGKKAGWQEETLEHGEDTRGGEQ